MFAFKKYILYLFKILYISIPYTAILKYPSIYVVARLYLLEKRALLNKGMIEADTGRRRHGDARIMVDANSKIIPQ
jgi:hypothetical protein